MRAEKGRKRPRSAIWAKIAGDIDPETSERLTWEEITRRADCQGRWVALFECRYDENGRATEGVLVDVDDNLSELCSRVEASQWQDCAIFRCA